MSQYLCEYYNIYEFGNDNYKVHSPILPDNCVIYGNMTTPPLLENPKGYHTKVEYCHDFGKNKLAGFRTWSNDKNDNLTIDYSPKTYDSLVKYKAPIWSFQEETGFFIVMYPSGERLPEFYDMEVKLSVLDNIKIRLNNTYRKR